VSSPQEVVQAGTLTIAQALALANRAVQHAAADEVWVVGTIAGLARSRPGHVYLQLADHEANGSTPTAVLPVVAFAREYAGITRTLAGAGVELANGLAVRLRGRLSVYAPKATVQLVATAIDPAVTVGEGTLRRRALLRALEHEGLLRRQHGLPMPTTPFLIGLVGPGGAGTADVLSVLQGSGLGFRVVRFPAATSGPGAPESIAAAIGSAARGGVDLVLVTRGGGPANELAAFDSEPAARAICQAAVPVITALGHSTDRTVADACARVVAITPTDAAAAIVDRLAGAEDLLLLEARRIAQVARARLGRETAALEGHAAAITAVRTQAGETASAHDSAHRARRTTRVVAVVAAVVVAFLLLVVMTLLTRS
jgi:exodeoxyribonuclease VII large subunit